MVKTCLCEGTKKSFKTNTGDKLFLCTGHAILHAEGYSFNTAQLEGYDPDAITIVVWH